MHSGYIKLWRKFIDTSFYKRSECVHLAIHLLLECNHEPNKFMFNGKEEVCDRGQTVTGLIKLSRETGISIRSLRTAIHSLTIVGFLTSKPTNRFRVISICRYDEYQAKPTSKPTNKRQSNDNQTTSQTISDSIIIDSADKNDKNDKNAKNTAPPFTPPQWIDPIAWRAFLDIRRRKGVADTTHALNLIIKELERLRGIGQKPKDILNQSIMSGWSGVFPLKGGAYSQHTLTADQRDREEMKKRGL